MRAVIRLPKERRTRELRIGSDTGLVGVTRYLGHVPEELAGLASAVSERLNDWDINVNPGLLPMSDGDLVVPDIAATAADGRTIAVECFIAGTQLRYGADLSK